MSLDFNGSSSYLITGARTIGDLYTVGGWFDADGPGGGAQGCFFSNASHGNIGRIMLLWNASGTPTLRIWTQYNAGDGIWDMTAPFASFTGWKWACAVYNATVPSQPVLYVIEHGVFRVLTVGAGLTQVGPPGGFQAVDNPTQWVIGNAVNYICPWDGRIGEFFFYKRILSELEVRSIAFRGVRTIPTPFDYLSMRGGSLAQLGSGDASWGNGGAAAAESPPARGLSGAVMLVG